MAPVELWFYSDPALDLSLMSMMARFKNLAARAARALRQLSPHVYLLGEFEVCDLILAELAQDFGSSERFGLRVPTAST
jgi:hypothetical protein